MNIYWLNPPLTAKVLHCDLAWINFSYLMPQYNWIQPVIDWDQFNSVDSVIEHIEQQPVDILMVSCYIWNHELCRTVSQQIRKTHANVKIIAGGPQLANHEPWMDYLCYAMGHGEQFLQALLPQLQNHGSVIDLDSVPFLITDSYRSPVITQRYSFPQDSAYVHNQVYVSNVVAAGKMSNKKVEVSLETTRGCPYSCTYCEWGGGIGTKISQRSIEAIYQDIDFLAIMGVNSIDIIDANFGILPRDVAVAQRLAQARKQYGYPKSVSLYGLAKTKTEKKEAILDILFDADLMSTYSMSIQSVNPQALDTARRTDVTVQEHLRLAKKYKQLYNKNASVELILGMPGSTLDDFYEEMNLFYEIDQWNFNRHVYNLLPNTESASVAYRQRNKIKSVQAGTFENGDQANHNDFGSVLALFKSSADIVVETFSYTAEQWKEMYIMNMAQRVLGPRVKYNAAQEMRQWFQRMKLCDWYKEIDQWVDQIIAGQLGDKNIKLINGRHIAEIVSQHLDDIDNN